jgi:hypothetical protein
MPLGAFRLNSLAKAAAAAGPPSRDAVTFTAVADAQVDTAQSKFGGASALFDGTGDTLTTDLDMNGLTTFTVEGWVRFNTTAVNQVIMAWNNDASFQTGEAFIQHHSTNGGVRAFFGGVSTGYTSVSTGTWYHWALTRNGSDTVTFWWNGSSAGTFTDSDSIGGGRNIQFSGFNGATPIQPLNGWLDELRVSNIARYTGSFTPSTSAFTNDDDTILLCHCDGADASTTFEDDVN